MTKNRLKEHSPMRKSPTKYTKKDFARLKRLMDGGLSMYWATKEIGMRWSVAAYHFKPEYRKRQRLAAKKHLKENPEKRRKAAREYAIRSRKLNPYKHVLTRRKYYLKNRAAMIASSARYRREHPEKIIEWRIKDRDRKRARRLRVRAMVEHLKEIINDKKILSSSREGTQRPQVRRVSAISPSKQQSHI